MKEIAMSVKIIIAEFIPSQVVSSKQTTLILKPQPEPITQDIPQTTPRVEEEMDIEKTPNKRKTLTHSSEIEN